MNKNHAMRWLLFTGLLVGLWVVPSLSNHGPYHSDRYWSTLYFEQAFTARKAEALGYIRSSGCVPDMGYHYVKPQEAQAWFEDRAGGQQALLYDETGYLVGVEYQFSAPSLSAPPIFGMAGPMGGHAPGMPMHYDQHIYFSEPRCPEATSETPPNPPLPAAARGPAIPQTGYLVEEVRDGLYWVTDGVYQVMFLTTGKGVVLVDAPPSLGAKLLQAIADVTDEPVTHLIYSHAHADHIGAAGLFPNNVTIIAQKETAALLTRARDPNRPVPTLTFSDTMTLQVGNQMLQLDYMGNNHEPGNIFIYAPRQKVLMLVDIVFPGWVPFKDLAFAKDIPGFIEAHDKALSYDFDVFIGGHLTRLGTRHDVEIQREFIQDVQANAAKALQTVSFSTVGQRVGFGNPYLLFEAYLNEVAQVCTDATLPKWIDRLGGADVFTFGHCLEMAESLRID